ncbi:phosphatidylinositol/phosphatidylcholine transfer protein SFH1 [Selaginella moellendorffii]|nr:phosphatidylinositol/phosphatidylcholine transfer protein SFH1 [Selaginella moellendorffii]|eukprot:XP_002984078.2 phosphatidylinositol/phosphatidylcholine transfer protein SFH1 [Selaginella moellendorffii]
MASIAADQISKLCPCSSRVDDILDRSGEERLARTGGGPQDLTLSQEEALNRFRSLLVEHNLVRKRDTDCDLLRFLRARSFDVAKAKAMYEAMLDWRMQVGADTIRETFDFPERNLVKNLYPHFHHKTDKLGRPLYIEKLGQLQVDELMKITTMDRMMMEHIQEWEILIEWKFPACSRKAGKTISQSLAILDLKGVTMKHMSKQVRHFIQNISKVDQDYYPEFLGKMFIVNAPMAFKAIWTVIKPWLDKRTQKKIEVHGSNFAPKLLELVDKQNLPEFLGGSCRCPQGCEYSDAGPWNEARYHISALAEEQDDGASFGDCRHRNVKDKGPMQWSCLDT